MTPVQTKICRRKAANDMSECMYDTAFQESLTGAPLDGPDNRFSANAMTINLKLLTARWVLPISAPAIEDAAIVIGDGRIKTVCQKSELASFYDETALRELKWTASDYGNAVITPGLINLHTHLEYSLLHELYSEQDESMFDWLPKLVGASWSWTPDKWKKSILYGAERSLAAGTTCIVDNSFTGQSARILAGMGLRAVVGLELFGQDETLAEGAWSRWLEKYNKVRYDADPLLQDAIEHGLMNITVAPHAPYTVAPALWKKAAAWASSNKQPVLAHVAESVAECAWIRNYDETIDRYLRHMREMQVKAGIYKSADAPATPWRSKGRSPIQMLADNELLNDRLVAAHLVQVDEKDLRLLKQGKVKVVHCPRSNKHLSHGLAPLKGFKNIGASVGLGTDSLASCPDLSMLQEAKAAIRMHAEAPDHYPLGAEEALRMITWRAANVIGMQNQLGTIEKEKLADLAVFQFDQSVENNAPHETLFSKEPHAVAAYVQGRLVSA
ncbi:MAG TPA: amidohydrolase family protein [Oculatellaceae cyanobacterium]